MIFTADRKELAEAIGRVAAGLPARPAQPVYAGLHLLAGADNAVKLTSSDGEMRFTSSADAGVVQQCGSCVVPGKLLSDISSYWAAGTVTFAREGSQLLITSGRSTFTLTAADGDIYPAWKEDVPAFLAVSGEELARGLRSVASSAGDQPVVLSGISMETDGDQLILVCTDHSRLAVASLVPGSFTLVKAPAPTILPAKTGERFARSCEGEVIIGWDDSLILMQHSGLRMTARRIAGNFLPWRSVAELTPAGGWVTLDTRELSRAVRMAQLATTGWEWITFTFTAGELAVSAAGQEGRACTEYVSCDYAGEEISSDFGARFLLDGLAGCGDTAEMAVLHQRESKLFIRSEGWDYMIQSRRQT
jgi:DNA polymerase III subunit beta